MGNREWGVGNVRSATGGFKGRRRLSLISSDPSNGYRIMFLICELDTHEGRSYNSPCFFANFIKYKQTQDRIVIFCSGGFVIKLDIINNVAEKTGVPKMKAEVAVR